MIITHFKLRSILHEFWLSKNHKEIPAIPLVPKDDPTTLFTGSGMQQLVPYLLGEIHPQGTRLYNIQRCFRSQDIDEVGDSCHTTMFEMVGNWSLGDYFKKEQLSWYLELYVEKLGLDPQKLFVTVFKGEDGIERDEESISIWKGLFAKYGITAEIGERIFPYGGEKNWWSRGGPPGKMPPGEPGGPSSEIFYRFDVEHNPAYGRFCHPNCECGRFLEIGNSVFMQYLKKSDGSFSLLPKKNVDFGGGFERIMAALNAHPDIFRTNLYSQIIASIEHVSNTSYDGEKDKPDIRVIADHLKAATFLIVDGVFPSNKEQGYFLRRLLRRSAVKMNKLVGKHLAASAFSEICMSVLKTYEGVYFDLKTHEKLVTDIVQDEISRFGKSLDKGLKEIQKLKHVDGKIAFDLFQTYGFPLEITEEIIEERGQKINRDEFSNEFNKHKELSRTASAGKFKGGLADCSEQTLKYHTATHLIHQALYDVFGSEIKQEGSNITKERLRFDFSLSIKPTGEQIQKVQEIVNGIIQKQLPVHQKIITKKEALALGAKAFFREKYPDMVKVYFVGDYSKEFCGGPHVDNTGKIGKISIFKFEKIGSNMYRIYARNA